MSRSIKQLREDLATLTLNFNNLAGELAKIYLNYLKGLGDSVAKQLILASYQICTQKYPESFLNLSFDRRSELQQKLKDLSLIFNQNLSNELLKTNSKNLKLVNNMQKVLGNEKDEKQANTQSSLDEENNQEQLTPNTLLQLYLHLEHSIYKTLNNLSISANNYLQEAEVLPNKLPPKILDMAIQAEEKASVMSIAPNLLNLLIERENEEEKPEKYITTVTAIHLRLPEIEFSNPTLSSYRNQIRSILAKLEKLREQYQQKQREYEIASAESAWRSSWFD